MGDALGLPIGLPLQTSGFGASFTAINLNASTVSVAWTFASLTSDPITRLAVRRSGLTGTSPTYQISLQGVDASGNPDGAIKSAGAALATFVATGLTLNGVTWLALGASYTPARGEPLAIVVEYSSGTIDGSNFLPISSAWAPNTTRQAKFAALSNGSSGVYTRSTSSPQYGYGTATTAYGAPVGASLSQNINSGAVAEAGALFALPAGWAESYQVIAARFALGTTVVGKSIACTLYDGGGAGDVTPLQSVTLDTDLFPTGGAWITFVFPEVPLATLSFGASYRIALSTPDASNQNLTGLSVTTAADMAAFPLGANFLLTTRSGGNWTDTATSRLMCELVLADITAPSPPPPPPPPPPVTLAPMVFGF